MKGNKSKCVKVEDKVWNDITQTVWEVFKVLLLLRHRNTQRKKRNMKGNLCVDPVRPFHQLYVHIYSSDRPRGRVFTSGPSTHRSVQSAEASFTLAHLMHDNTRHSTAHRLKTYVPNPNTFTWTQQTSQIIILHTAWIFHSQKGRTSVNSFVCGV